MSHLPQDAEPRFEAIDRSQCFFQTVDLEELIPEGHRARLLWKLLGEMDLSRFAAGVKAVEHRPGRNAISPRLLIAMWLYAYSRGISSAREIARQSQYEPGLRWLTAQEVVNHHTLSDFRVKQGEGLQQLFVQVLGMLSLKKLITLERVTVDGTKIRANVNKKSFSRASTIREHLSAAQRHVEGLQQEETEQEKRGRRAAAQRRAAKERTERLKSALEEIQKLQRQDEESDQRQVSRTDSDARFMQTNDGGLAPSYNVQLATDGANKLFVGMRVSQQANDATHLVPVVEEVKGQLGKYPKQVIADGDYTNRAGVMGMQEREIDFIGSWKAATRTGNYGIAEEYQAKAFHYDGEHNEMICPEGQRLGYKSQQRIEGDAFFRIFAADKEVCLACPQRMQCCPKNSMSRYGRMVSVLQEDPRIAEYHQKMKTPESKAVYKTRAPIAEFPHAWLKTKFNFVRYRCRGLKKVAAETMWVCLAYNLQVYFRLAQPA